MPMLTLHAPLIAATSARAKAPTLRFVDCRFRLDDPLAGRAAYQAARLPNAAFLDLEDDLSGPIDLAKTGRHPLPTKAALREAFARAGLSQQSHLVFYDDAGGAFAARAWWSAAYLGHTAAQVLDGGLDAWLRADGELNQTPAPVPTPAPMWTEQPALAPTASLEAVITRVASGGQGLVDARALPRFRGEIEPIDPVAGHIPGALCMPHSENLADTGCFKDAETLRERWAPLFAAGPAPIAYCGSGVTAAHNLLAMAAAGLCQDALPALYVGSFSEWIRDPARPVARDA